MCNLLKHRLIEGIYWRICEAQSCMTSSKCVSVLEFLIESSPTVQFSIKKSRWVNLKKRSKFEEEESSLEPTPVQGIYRFSEKAVWSWLQFVLEPTPEQLSSIDVVFMQCWCNVDFSVDAVLCSIDGVDFSCIVETSLWKQSHVYMFQGRAEEALSSNGRLG